MADKDLPAMAPAKAPDQAPDQAEVIEDGQEEVFSRTAVEKGLIEDPKAMDPRDVRHPGPGGRPPRRGPGDRGPPRPV